MRCRRVALVALILCTVVATVVAPAAAQDEPPDTEETSEQSVGGVLRVDDEPVEGVTVAVATVDGEEVGAATTNENGQWNVPLPSPGQYAVTLDVESLPEGVMLRDPERPTLSPTVRIGRQAQLLFALVGEGSSASGGSSTLDDLAQNALNGIRFGLIIAMTAIGLSLIFGTTGLINFAHGELVAFGAIVAWFLNTSGPELHLVAAGGLAIVAGGLLGGGLETGLWRPLRNQRVGSVQRLVISIGLALVVRHVLLVWFGGRSRSYRDYAIQDELAFGPFSVTARDLVIIAMSLAILFGVAAVLERTRIGKAMRAVSDDAELAESSGIDVKRVVLFVWVMGAALAATGGVFLGTIESVNYLMGFRLLLLMFAGVILGGLGTAYGAIVGSLVVGLATEVSTTWLSPELKFVWALVVLIAVLLVRPQGILGVRERVG